MKLWISLKGMQLHGDAAVTMRERQTLQGGLGLFMKKKELVSFDEDKIYLLSHYCNLR